MKNEKFNYQSLFKWLNELQKYVSLQAKKFVESAPNIVKADVTKDEAEALKTALEKVGATIEID